MTKEMKMEEPPSTIASHRTTQLGRTRLDLKRRPIEGPGRPEFYRRIPAVRVRIRCDSTIHEEQVEEKGIMLINTLFPPSPIASGWLQTRTLKTISVPCLPEGAAICLVGAEQRVFIKHSPNITRNSFLGSRLLLDLGSSSCRDIFGFSCRETHLLIKNRETDESCTVTLKLDQREITPRTSMQSGPIVRIESPDDLVFDDTEPVQVTTGISRAISVQVLINGDVVSNIVKDTGGYILLGDLSAIRTNETGASGVALPLNTQGSFIAGLSVDEERGFIIKSRQNQPSSVQLLLVIPDNQDFPLMYGDRFVVEAAGKLDAIEFQAEKSTLQRAISSSGRTDQPLHPAQIMSSIALEIPVRARLKEPDVVEGVNASDQVLRSVTTEYLMFTPSTETFSIGRMSTDVFLPDPHLSKLHAKISRMEYGESSFFHIAPLGDRPIFMLLGKKEQHYRPPLALRKGDIITAGKSEFQVVYKQRGDPGWVPRITMGEELTQRLRRKESENEEEAPMRPSFEIKPKLGLDKLGQTPEAPVGLEEDGGAKLVLDSFNISSVDSKSPFLILVGVRGPAAGKCFLCDPSETVIGAGIAASIRIPEDRRMSPVHCRIFFEQQQRRWMVQDLQSKHGTFLKIIGDQSVLLSVGDVFVMGQTSVRVLGQQGNLTPREIPKPSRRTCCVIA